MNKNSGFSLVELLMVVAIVGILMGIALPSYKNSVTKSRRADAQSALSLFATEMESYYASNSTYQGAAAGGADTGAPTVYPAEVPLDGSDKYYRLSIQSATGAIFTLRATPINQQVGDGLLEINSLGEKFWDKNDDGDTVDAGENNWDAH